MWSRIASKFAVYDCCGDWIRTLWLQPSLWCAETWHQRSWVRTEAVRRRRGKQSTTYWRGKQSTTYWHGKQSRLTCWLGGSMLSLDERSECLLCRCSVSCDAGPCQLHGRGPVLLYQAHGQAGHRHRVCMRQWDGTSVSRSRRGCCKPHSLVTRLTYGAEAAGTLMLLQLVIRHDLFAPLSRVHTQKSTHPLGHLLQGKIPDPRAHVAPTHRTLCDLFDADPAAEVSKNWSGVVHRRGHCRHPRRGTKGEMNCASKRISLAN